MTKSITSLEASIIQIARDENALSDVCELVEYDPDVGSVPEHWRVQWPVLMVARAIESAATAPLLERIAELEAKLAQQAEAQEPVAWRVHPFDYCIGSDGVYAVTHFDQQAEAWRRKGWAVEPLFTRPQPAQLQRLSEDEVHAWWTSTNGMEDHDMCNKENFRDAVRRVEKKLADKNGAVLK